MTLKISQHDLKRHIKGSLSNLPGSLSKKIGANAINHSIASFGTVRAFKPTFGEYHDILSSPVKMYEEQMLVACFQREKRSTGTLDFFFISIPPGLDRTAELIAEICVGDGVTLQVSDAEIKSVKHTPTHQEISNFFSYKIPCKDFDRISSIVLKSDLFNGSGNYFREKDFLKLLSDRPEVCLAIWAVMSQFEPQYRRQVFDQYITMTEATYVFDQKSLTPDKFCTNTPLKEFASIFGESEQLIRHINRAFTSLGSNLIHSTDYPFLSSFIKNYSKFIAKDRKLIDRISSNFSDNLALYRALPDRLRPHLLDNDIHHATLNSGKISEDIFANFITRIEEFKAWLKDLSLPILQNDERNKGVDNWQVAASRRVDKITSHIIAKILLKGVHHDFKLVYESLEQWHRRVLDHGAPRHEVIEKNLLKLRQKLYWPPLIKEPYINKVNGKNLILDFASSTDFLIQLGREQNICVGRFDYDKKCLFEGEHIGMISQEDDKGAYNIIGTVRYEIVKTKSGPALSSIQHKGRSNSSPDYIQKLFLKSFERYMSGPTLKDRLDKIEPLRNSMVDDSKRQKAINEVNFEPLIRDVQSSFRNLASQSLPQPFRGESIIQFLRRLEVM